MRIKRVLADGRSSLDLPTYTKFLDWTEQQAERQVRGVFAAPFVYAEFGLLPRRRMTSLFQELRFAALHIDRASRAISAQLKLQRIFEAAAWVGSNDLLEGLLSNIEEGFGQSLWLLEATIATKQYVSGLEAQKRFVEKVGKAAKRRQAEYVSYHLGVRNEPNVTPARFAEEFERLLKRTKFSPPVRIYLLYKVAGLLPLHQSGLADLLLVEHGSADIDLYETFLAVCQEIVSKDPSSEVAGVVYSLGEQLVRVIDDFRLRQILLIGGKSAISISAETLNSTDFMLGGRLKEALKISCKSLRSAEVNTNELMAIGLILAAAGQDRSPSKSKKLLDQQTRNLAALMRKGSEYERANADLQKVASNWAFMPSVKAITAFAQWDSLPHDGEPASWAYKRVLNSPADDFRSTLGVLRLAPTAPAQTELMPAAITGLTVELIRVLSDPKREIPASLESHLGVALGLLRRMEDSSPPRWEQLWADLKTSHLTDFLRNRCAVHFVHHLLLADEHGLAADVLVDLVLTSRISPAVLPLRELAGGDSWRRLKQFSSNIAIPIVLDLIWKVTGDDRDSTAKRFAVQNFLSAHSLTAPSQLSTMQGNVSRERLVYFLDIVCAPTVLDMLPTLSSSQMVEDERLNICRALTEIDPRNSDRYQDEILVSEHQRVVRSGLRVVDSSRIHVDQDALTVWAVKELSETFRRYCDLVKAGVGVADNYDTVIRAFFKADEINKAYFEIPKSEADDILFRMVSQLADRFINDSDFGLDSYLSKRVRHESLTSYLRNPLERQALITQIDSKTGKYEPNMRWGAASLKYPADIASLIEEWLRAFSESFDKILVSLRTDDFHIRSKDKPSGLFEFALTAPMLHLLRSIIQQRMEAEDFAPTCLTLFWVTLNPSLERARDHLRVDTKTKVAALFEQLRAKLYSLIYDYPAVAELSAVVGDASAAVQAEIDNVAEWFVRQEVSQGRHRYTFEQAVEIATESALRGMRNFEPDIHIASTGDSLIAASELIVIADVMRVALGNVKAHSNQARGRPKVEIDIVENLADEVISFRVLSDIGVGVRCDESEKRLEEIRSDIAAKTYGVKVRSEGGSGLRKLASIVHQSDRGRIDFRFESDEKFILEVDLSFFVASQLGAAA